MKKRFIVLLDFSDYADNLLRYAYSWSTEVGAQIVVAHETALLMPGIADYETRRNLAEEANEDALSALKERVADTLPQGVYVEYEVSERPLQQTVADLLSVEGTKNLVFVGVKGTGLFKKIFVGSMAVQLIDYTRNTVVAIPHSISKFSHERLYIAVSDRHPLNMGELEAFLEFIDPHRTTLTFIYLAKPGEDTSSVETRLDELVERFGAGRYDAKRAIYQGRSAFKDIKEVINDKIEELLIVQRGSRLLTDHLFRRFLISELVYEGRTPLVVLP